MSSSINDHPSSLQTGVDARLGTHADQHSDDVGMPEQAITEIDGIGKDDYAAAEAILPGYSDRAGDAGTGTFKSDDDAIGLELDAAMDQQEDMSAPLLPVATLSPGIGRIHASPPPQHRPVSADRPIMGTFKPTPTAPSPATPSLSTPVKGTFSPEAIACKPATLRPPVTHLTEETNTAASQATHRTQPSTPIMATARSRTVVAQRSQSPSTESERSGLPAIASVYKPEKPAASPLGNGRTKPPPPLATVPHQRQQHGPQPPVPSQAAASTTDNQSELDEELLHLHQQQLPEDDPMPGTAPKPHFSSLGPEAALAMMTDEEQAEHEFQTSVATMASKADADRAVALASAVVKHHSEEFALKPDEEKQEFERCTRSRRHLEVQALLSSTRRSRRTATTMHRGHKVRLEEGEGVAPGEAGGDDYEQLELTVEQLKIWPDNPGEDLTNGALPPQDEVNGRHPDVGPETIKVQPENADVNKLRSLNRQQPQLSTNVGVHLTRPRAGAARTAAAPGHQRVGEYDSVVEGPQAHCGFKSGSVRIVPLGDMSDDVKQLVKRTPYSPHALPDHDDANPVLGQHGLPFAAHTMSGEFRRKDHSDVDLDFVSVEVAVSQLCEIFAPDTPLLLAYDNHTVACLEIPQAGRGSCKKIGSIQGFDMIVVRHRPGFLPSNIGQCLSTGYCVDVKTKVTYDLGGPRPAARIDDRRPWLPVCDRTGPIAVSVISLLLEGLGVPVVILAAAGQKTHLVHGTLLRLQVAHDAVPLEDTELNFTRRLETAVDNAVTVNTEDICLFHATPHFEGDNCFEVKNYPLLGLNGAQLQKPHPLDATTQYLAGRFGTVTLTRKGVAFVPDTSSQQQRQGGDEEGGEQEGKPPHRSKGSKGKGKGKGKGKSKQDKKGRRPCRPTIKSTSGRRGQGNKAAEQNSPTDESEKFGDDDEDGRRDDDDDAQEDDNDPDYSDIGDDEEGPDSENDSEGLVDAPGEKGKPPARRQEGNTKGLSKKAKKLKKGVNPAFQNLPVNVDAEVHKIKIYLPIFHAIKEHLEYPTFKVRGYRAIRYWREYHKHKVLWTLRNLHLLAKTGIRIEHTVCVRSLLELPLNWLSVEGSARLANVEIFFRDLVSVKNVADGANAIYRDLREFGMLEIPLQESGSTLSEKGCNVLRYSFELIRNAMGYSLGVANRFSPSVRDILYRGIDLEEYLPTAAKAANKKRKRRKKRQETMRDMASRVSDVLSQYAAPWQSEVITNRGRFGLASVREEIAVDSRSPLIRDLHINIVVRKDDSGFSVVYVRSRHSAVLCDTELGAKDWAVRETMRRCADRDNCGVRCWRMIFQAKSEFMPLSLAAMLRPPLKMDGTPVEHLLLPPGMDRLEDLPAYKDMTRMLRPSQRRPSERQGRTAPVTFAALYQNGALACGGALTVEELWPRVAKKALEMCHQEGYRLHAELGWGTREAQFCDLSCWPQRFSSHYDWDGIPPAKQTWDDSLVQRLRETAFQRYLEDQAVVAQLTYTSTWGAKETRSSLGDLWRSLVEAGAFAWRVLPAAAQPLLDGHLKRTVQSGTTSETESRARVQKLQQAPGASETPVGRLLSQLAQHDGLYLTWLVMEMWLNSARPTQELADADSIGLSGFTYPCSPWTGGGVQDAEQVYVGVPGFLLLPGLTPNLFSVAVAVGPQEAPEIVIYNPLGVNSARLLISRFEIQRAIVLAFTARSACAVFEPDPNVDKLTVTLAQGPSLTKDSECCLTFCAVMGRIVGLLTVQPDASGLDVSQVIAGVELNRRGLQNFAQAIQEMAAEVTDGNLQPTVEDAERWEAALADATFMRSQTEELRAIEQADDSQGAALSPRAFLTEFMETGLNTLLKRWDKVPAADKWRADSVNRKTGLIDAALHWQSRVHQFRNQEARQLNSEGALHRYILWSEALTLVASTPEICSVADIQYQTVALRSLADALSRGCPDDEALLQARWYGGNMSQRLAESRRTKTASKRRNVPPARTQGPGEASKKAKQASNRKDAGAKKDTPARQTRKRKPDAGAGRKPNAPDKQGGNASSGSGSESEPDNTEEGGSKRTSSRKTRVQGPPAKRAAAGSSAGARADVDVPVQGTPMGLANRRNICFANAVLQALAVIEHPVARPQFLSVLRQVVAAEVATSHEAKILLNMMDGGPAPSSRARRYSCKKAMPSLGLAYRQLHDSAEYLELLLVRGCGRGQPNSRCPISCLYPKRALGGRLKVKRECRRYNCEKYLMYGSGGLWGAGTAHFFIV